MIEKYINLSEAKKLSRKDFLKMFKDNPFIRGKGYTAEEYYKELHKDEQTAKSNKKDT